MNYYDLLEISRNASDEVIKNAYRALVKKYHPDIASSNKEEIEEKMRQINEAYEVLSNKEKRALYDEELKQKELEKSQNSDIKQQEVHLTNDINNDYEDNNYVKNPEKEEDTKKKLRKKIIIIALILFFSVAILSFALVSIFVEPQKTDEEQNEEVIEEKEEKVVEDKTTKEPTQKTYEDDYEVKEYDDDEIIDNKIDEETNNNNIDDGIIKIY